MKRSVLLFISLVAAAALAVPARAQNVYFNTGGDSVLALKPGATRTVELDAYHGGYGVGTYSVTLRFDPSVVHFLGATGTTYMQDPTVTLGSGQVTLSGIGAAYTYPYVAALANVTLSLDAAATTGSLVQIDANQLLGYFGTDFLAQAANDVANVCTATNTWGDIDGNGTINTRDALIALSAAVGLPTAPFNLTYGDVDSDGLVTSRDALFMLSAGIGLPLTGRTGNGVPDKCAPLFASPADLVISDALGVTYRINAGDTLRTTVPLAFSRDSTTPIRWSPVSSLLAYECYTTAGISSDICVVDGTGAASPGHLNVGGGTRVTYPAWSPDGSQLAYIQDYGGYGNIYIVDANGANNHQVLASYGAMSLSWSPDGTRLLFTSCCYSQFTVPVDGSAPAELFPSSYANSPRDAVWSPAGDSVAYTGSGFNFIFRKSNGADAGIPAIKFSGGAQYPSWANAGLAFQRPRSASGGDVWFQQNSDQRFYRLTHSAVFGDQWIDLKRNPGVWIFSIAVAPTNQTLSLSSSPTLQLTATVTNSNSTTNTTSPVTWSSANPSIASVNATGLVSAVSQGGPVYIRATVGGWRTDSTQVTVGP